MVKDSTRALANTIKRKIESEGINAKDLTDLLDICIHVLANEDDLEWSLKVSNYIKTSCSIGIRASIQIYELDSVYWNTLRFEAPFLFESFLYYMEKNRRSEKKFYRPRVCALKTVVDDLQDLEDGKIKFLGISLPPRVGKSTLCIFFLAWIIGKRPHSHNAMSGHSGILADRFYNDVFKLTESEDYTFHEIFPKVKKPKTSSDKNELAYDKRESFATLTCRGIDGTWTGAVDISNDGYLYVDDMVRDRTESMNASRLNNRYQDYLNVLVDRKNDGAKELMVGTRWNLLDPLGRIKSDKKDNPMYRFREIPALDENEKSNFEYDYGLGFSTEYYLDLKDRLDTNEWMAKYQQDPFVREGLLLPEEELRTYNGVLPDGEFIKAAACDVAWGGGDNVSMPFGWAFGDGDIYIGDWIYNGGDKTITKPLVVAKCLKHEPNRANFEANNGGHEYADDIDRQLRNFGFKTSITSSIASNKVGKLAKIIQYADDVKNRFVFLAKEYRSEEYQKGFEEITMFTKDGKNESDDGMDSLIQLFVLIDQGLMASVTAGKNPYY